MRRNPLIQLILIHFREFVREPANHFLVYNFSCCHGMGPWNCFFKTKRTGAAGCLNRKSPVNNIPFSVIFLKIRKKSIKEIYGDNTTCFDKTIDFG